VSIHCPFLELGYQRVKKNSDRKKEKNCQGRCILCARLGRIKSFNFTWFLLKGNNGWIKNGKNFRLLSKIVSPTPLEELIFDINICEVYCLYHDPASCHESGVYISVDHYVKLEG
jgi:hypothetical protein